MQEWHLLWGCFTQTNGTETPSFSFKSYIQLNCVLVWNTLKWTTFVWLSRVHRKKHVIWLLYTLLTLWTHRCIHSLSLCWTLISLHPKEPTEGISAYPICSAALNQRSAIFPKPPGLSKGLLLPNDRYKLQSKRPEAPYQDPGIICTFFVKPTKTRCFVTSHILACMHAVYGFVYYLPAK